jgi:hypothetical protein
MFGINARRAHHAETTRPPCRDPAGVALKKIDFPIALSILSY